MPTVPPAPPDAVHTLYADHHAWLQRWLRRKLGCAFEAADLAHDVYVRLLVSRRLPLAHESRAYLTQIAKGLVVDLFRPRPAPTPRSTTSARRRSSRAAPIGPDASVTRLKWRWPTSFC
ncbi:MAG: sigma factor [Janthinobacterium lividum]